MLSTNKSLKVFFLQLRQFALAAVLVFSSSGQADDTEIYMGKGASDNSETHPNVLFILDTSGSMNSRDAGANKRTPRMTVLKEAMDDLLTNLDNVNVGISRFSNSGGSVLFPITPINGNAKIVVGESDGKQKALEFKNTLLNVEDDAEERVAGASAGQVFLHDDVLEAFDFGGTSGQSGSETIEVAINTDDISEFNSNGRMLNTSFAYIHNLVSTGVRFQSVNIAQGTTIISAFIDFTHKLRRTKRTNAVISGLDISNTSTFSTSSRDLSSRQTTSATVAWDGIPGGKKNKKFSTPDLKDIVQEIVDRSDWSSGNAMGFKIFTSKGQRLPYARNASSTRQPKLRITLQATAGAEGDDQIIALRFEDVRIPRGAKLQEAKLLVTNSAAGGPDSVVWTMSTEQVDNSQPFTSTSGSLSARKGGGGVVNWTVKTDVLNVKPAECGTGCTEQRTKPTNDIKSIIEEVTGRQGWCGGNAITIFIEASSPTADQMRLLHSRDSTDAQLAPSLFYTYMPQSGCMNKTEVAQIARSGDDAEQFNDSYSGNRVSTVGNDLVLGDDTDSGRGNQIVGLRFSEVDIPKQATIKSAHIEFRAKGKSTGAASYTIKGINEDNIGAFRSKKDGISGSRTTNASTNWEMSVDTAEDGWDDPGAQHQTEDLTSVVQEIVNRPGWSNKNNMGFVISGTGTRRCESFDNDPSKAPRLVVEYDDSVDIPFKSVREVLKEKVRNLPARGGTPIAGAMLESAKYFRGEKMRHGKNRGQFGEISHPGSYCIGPGNCPGAKPTTSGGGYYGGGGGTTDEFMVLNPRGCTENNLGSFKCNNRKINGSPEYISPIKNDLECASNHQVLLTDGQAGTRDDSAIRPLLPNTKWRPEGNKCYKNNDSFRLKEDKKHSYVHARSSYGYGYGGGSSNTPTPESCVPDLVEFQSKVDQNKRIPGDQLVKTHTVAFNIKGANSESNRQFLKDVANLGGGGAYTADTAGDLQEVFEVILSEVRSAPTSFAAPALAVNAFNKLESRSDVYYGMFTPDLSQRWNGNLKKYKLCISGDCVSESTPVGTVLDATGKSTIDSKTNKFLTTSQSVWSDSQDGPFTTQGGAGAEIEDHTQTTLYTDRKDSSGYSSTDLVGANLDEVPGFKLQASDVLSTDFTEMRGSICSDISESVRTTAGGDCEKRMLWLLGKLHTTDANNDVNANTRWSVNDILHSSPSVITYGGVNTSSGQTFFDKVVYGTNAGFLHMVNGLTGKEEWRYMPSDFWSMQRQLFNNRQDTHTYGLDGKPVVWACDQFDDGSIDQGTRNISPTSGAGSQTCESSSEDFVRVITSTRRGGGDHGFIYALDLSPTKNITDDATGQITPKFMWRISGGGSTGDFTRLGQTWSDPKIATIMVNPGAPHAKDVLIFGGGYDPKLDDNNIFSTSDNDGSDFLGNAIYIVNPMNGEKMLSISGKGTGADIEVDDMHFSIPSAISILDSNSDGQVDRLYVGDLGGQVWRVDLAQALPISGNRATGTVIGKLADVSGNTAGERRRFFSPPSVVQVKDTAFSETEEYDYVLIGSGDRPHPLLTTEKDKFYAFRDRFIAENSLKDSNGDHVCGDGDGYPKSNHKPISHDDAASLINATTKGLKDHDADAVQSADGYFFDFAEANSGKPGEKALSAPLTVGGAVAFTTFDPTVEQGTGNQTSGDKDKSDPCGAVPNIGTARAYHINILSGDIPETSEVARGRGANRLRKTIGSGIPSDVVPLFTRDGIVGITQSDGIGQTLGPLSQNAPERAYWNESIEF